MILQAKCSFHNNVLSITVVLKIHLSLQAMILFFSPSFIVEKTKDSIVSDNDK